VSAAASVDVGLLGDRPAALLADTDAHPYLYPYPDTGQPDRPGRPRTGPGMIQADPPEVADPALPVADPAPGRAAGDGPATPTAPAAAAKDATARITAAGITAAGIADAGIGPAGITAAGIAAVRIAAAGIAAAEMPEVPGA
jgi:hypothetical protein